MTAPTAPRSLQAFKSRVLEGLRSPVKNRARLPLELHGDKVERGGPWSPGAWESNPCSATSQRSAVAAGVPRAQLLPQKEKGWLDPLTWQGRRDAQRSAQYTTDFMATQHEAGGCFTYNTRATCF